MRDLLLGLRIRIKLLAAFGSILLISALLIIISGVAFDKIIYFKNINEEVDMLKLRLETMDLATMEFIYEGYKSKSFLEKQEASAITTFETNHAEASRIVALIRDMRSDNSAGDQTTNKLATTLDDLHTDFTKLVTLLKRRGFKDFGMEGSLRTAIHAIENSRYEFDKTSMLMLRRHEKDFFLRKELKYQDEFNVRFENFKLQLAAASSEQLITFLENYKKEFNGVVDIEKEIGLTEGEGIRGRIDDRFVKIRPQIELLRASMKEQSEIQIHDTRWLLWIVFATQIIAGIVMALVYAGLLTKSIKEIRNGMQKLADGVFPDKLRVRTTEEIGQTKTSFNQFIDRLKAATSFAERLGSGESNIRYDEKYNNDVLAQSLINAQEKLQKAEEIQQNANWINEGMSNFNEIIKNDSEDTVVLAEQILKVMVCYLNVNQGALYIVNESEGDRYLERVATYAYGKKKFITEKVDNDTGLLGQCVLEGNMIYLRDLPQDFVRITSGLGEAPPRNVIITPLKTRDKVIGVLELASFHQLEPHQLKFIELATESVASLLSTKKAALETKRLLKESEERAFSLAQQEEEMRQNAEELKATQEEMERQKAHLQEEIRSLKERLDSMAMQTSF